jgi:hypothetical protein
LHLFFIAFITIHLLPLNFSEANFRAIPLLVIASKTIFLLSFKRSEAQPIA